jgi:hypothetical protein
MFVIQTSSEAYNCESQTTYREVKYKFEYCFLYFIFLWLSEKVFSVFSRYSVRKQESFLATRKLESQILEQEIFSLPNMSEYHSPLGISLQWSHFYCNSYTQGSIYDAQWQKTGKGSHALIFRLV